MPKFSYVVKDKESKTYKDVADAPSEEVVVERLQQQGYFIVSIKEIAAPSAVQQSHSASGKRKFSYRRVKLYDLLTFARQLATMLESGVTLLRALEVSQLQTQSQRFYYILGVVKRDVEQGRSLSVALRQHPKIFNQFWVSLAEVGEASGTLPVVLSKLANHLEQDNAFRSAIVSSLIYPAILMVVATIAIMVFALFVGPRFEDIFKSLGAPLPILTQMILETFKFIKMNLPILIISIILGIFILRAYFKSYTGRLLWEKIMFRLPKVGEIYKLIVVERFTSQMSILIDSGVPILYALDICERLVSNITCSLIISSVKEGVREGSPLANPMEKSGFFPPMTLQMISVGEETGELGKMLKHVSAFYQSNVEVFLKRASTIIEPFMIIFMGIFIGTIVIAMFLPLFNIAQLGGGRGSF